MLHSLLLLLAMPLLAQAASDEIGEEMPHASQPLRPPQAEESLLPLYIVGAVFLLLAAAIGKWAYAQGHDPVKKGGRQQADDAEAVGGGRRNNALARMRARRQAGGDAEEDEEDLAGGKKVGAKKMAKLEAKEEKRAMREAMEEDRKKRKEAQEKAEEEAREKQKAREEEQRQKEEEERKAIEEQKKKEEEEFDKWKDMFETADDGAQADDDLQESQGMLQEFIDYLKNKKISALDEVAGEFKLKSQEVVNRVEGLEAMGRITGLLDDRGKFIYISLDEMQQVAKWIKREGRISVSDLATESNKLIDLNPKEVAREVQSTIEPVAEEAS